MSKAGWYNFSASTTSLVAVQANYRVAVAPSLPRGPGHFSMTQFHRCLRPSHRNWSRIRQSVSASEANLCRNPSTVPNAVYTSVDLGRPPRELIYIHLPFSSMGVWQWLLRGRSGWLLSLLFRSHTKDVFNNQEFYRIQADRDNWLSG